MPTSLTDSILARLIAAGGFLPEARVEEARLLAEREGLPLRDALLRQGVPPDVLAALEAAARSASSTSSAQKPPSGGLPATAKYKPDEAASSPTITSPARQDLGSSPTIMSGKAPTSDATILSPSGTNLPRRAPGRLTHIGKYEILGEIGRGGMGVVYRARHPGLDRVVAVKTLLSPGSQEHVERFLREARSSAKMGKHPNIVQVHDVGEEEGVYFFTMEFIEGHGFDHEVHVEKPAPRRVAEVVEQVARGLGHAHSEGVVHRDMKPSNILIDLTRRPLITDFGLAKEVGAESSVSIAGQILGTPAYMSPEQAEGRLDLVNEKSDVYGLGCVLYEGLTRKPPFEGQGNIEILRKVTGFDPVPPSRVNSAVPRDLEVVCLKAMSKRPEDRYESAAALADDLKRFLDGDSILARPIPWAVRVVRRVRKNRLVSSLAAIAVLLLGVGAGVTVKLGRERADQRKQKEAREAEAAAADARRREVEERVRSGRELLEKGERALRPDIAALSGQAADRGMFDQAAAVFGEALALQPAHLEARRLRARALRLSRRPESAAAEASAALEVQPGDPAALTERILANLDLLRTAMGNLSNSYLANLTALGALQHRRTWVNTSATAEPLRERIRADIAALGDASMSKGHPPFFRAMLLALDPQNNDAGALEAFAEAIAADPFLVEAYRNRAFVLSRVNYVEALKEYRVLARAQPYDAEIQAELALLEDSKEATLAAIDAAVKAAPEASWVYDRRGTIRLYYMNLDAAEDDFQRARDLDPDSSAATSGLHHIAYNRGDFETADRWLAEWKSAAVPDPIAWWEAGAYYRICGRWELAEAAFQRAIDLDPDYVLYLFARGRARVMLKDYAAGAKDMLDSVGKGDMGAAGKKVYSNMRPALEKQIASCKTPEQAAKFCEGLTNFLDIALNFAGTEERRVQYRSSITQLRHLASDLHVQAGNIDNARTQFEKVELYGDSWIRDLVFARLDAMQGYFGAAQEKLRSAKSRGMVSLGAVRIDPDFASLREEPGWAAFVESFGERK